MYPLWIAKLHDTGSRYEEKRHGLERIIVASVQIIRVVEVSGRGRGSPQYTRLLGALTCPSCESTASTWEARNLLACSIGLDQHGLQRVLICLSLTHFEFNVLQVFVVETHDLQLCFVQGESRRSSRWDSAIQRGVCESISKSGKAFACSWQ